MKNFRYYFTLMLYPLGFFVVLGAVQILILRQAYEQQADRQLRPYVNGQPVSEVRARIDRRPQSIDIPSLDTDATPATTGKTDRAANPLPRP